MTLEFDNYVSDEELEAASEFYDDLEFDLDLERLEVESSLEALEEETRLADAEWDEHWANFDMELLGDDGDFHSD
tara:strand:- start:401 stop:625 length:225 start_codon:yes stop_codon:yes gene_type:complete